MSARIEGTRRGQQRYGSAIGPSIVFAGVAVGLGCVALPLHARGMSSAGLAHPGAGIVVDSLGRIYFSDTTRDVVWRIELDGRLSPVRRGVHTNLIEIDSAGALRWPDGGYAGDFYYAVRGPDGAVYATIDSRVVRQTSNGEPVTLAGDTASGFRDGQGTVARFSRPQGLALDSAGNVYVADHRNRALRRITPSGEVTTIRRSSWPWAPVGVTYWGGGLYVVERFGDYFKFPPLPKWVAGIVGHPRVWALTIDGEGEVVAEVGDWRLRAVVAACSVLALAWVLHFVWRRLH